MDAPEKEIRTPFCEGTRAACRELNSASLFRRQFLQTLGAAAGAAFVGELTLPYVRADASNPSDTGHLVRIGQTDLYVTRYCQGTAFRQVPRSDNPKSLAILHRCLDVGINFFDSAEAYGWGGSERVLGRAIAGQRDRIVICTKAAPSLAPERAPDTNTFRHGRRVALSREVLFHKAEGSLKRLNTEYLDLYLIHSPDEVTPLEEIADSMDALVRSGRIRYWGVSNFAAPQVERLVALGGYSQQAPIAGSQDYYNIVARERLDPDLLAVLGRSRLGLMAYSPLDTGRLAPGHPIAPAQRPVVAALDRVADELGATRPQVCIA